MTNHVTNQTLNRHIDHLTQHLPNKEELNGVQGGTSYFRKVNDDTFCHAFQRSHQQLNGLKSKYLLTDEQLSFVDTAQKQLISEIKEAYAAVPCLPKSMQYFLSHCDNTHRDG